MHHYTAVMKQKGDWWIGWIAEVPGVNCQERPKEELKATLWMNIGVREEWRFLKGKTL